MMITEFITHGMIAVLLLSGNQEWVSLFNGADLEGWDIKCQESDKDKNYWTVANGSILCDTKGDSDHGYIWLQSREEYGDLELRLKFQAYSGHLGNSGVQVRSRYDSNAVIDGDEPGWMDGPQVDIDPNNPWRNGLIYDETRTNRRWINPSLPDWEIDKESHAPEKVVNYFSNEGPGWNDLRIICKGMHITTYVNDILVSDYDGSGILDDGEHKKLNVGSSGHICLQLHKDSVNKIGFKDLKIRLSHSMSHRQ